MEELKSSTDEIYTNRRRSRDRRCVLVLAVLVGVCVFVIGILLGRYAACPSGETDQPDAGDGVFLKNVPLSLMKDADPAIADELINGMKPDNIRNNLK